MALPADTAWLSLRALGQKLRDKEFSAVELAEFFLDRLERHGKRLNAVVTVTRELALRQAAAADQELAAGKDRGPLHGIPYGAKICWRLPAFLPLGCSGFERPDVRRRRDGRAPPARSRRRAGRQTGDGRNRRRIGLPASPCFFHRSRFESVGPRCVERRFIERLRRRRRRGARAVRRRFGDLGIDHDAGRLLRGRRTVA